MTIVRSYWTLTRVWRSKNVSGSRKERISPDPPGAKAVLASAIESGQTQCPSSLLLDAPSEGEGTRGASGDFDQMGWIWFRKTKESPTFEPVMIRPVTYCHPMKFASKEKRDWRHTIAVIAWIESPLSASSSSRPVIFSFSKNVGSDFEDFALLKTLSVIQGFDFPSATWKMCSVGSRRRLMG